MIQGRLVKKLLVIIYVAISPSFAQYLSVKTGGTESMKFASQVCSLTSQVGQTRKTLVESLEVWVVGMK